VKKILSILIIVFLFIFVLCGSASAATVKTCHVYTSNKNIVASDVVGADDTYTVTLGKDKTFTIMNEHRVWTQRYDSSHGMPNIDGSSSGNVAKVSNSAGKGKSGGGHVSIGVKFNYDLSNYDWNKVKNWPIEVTLNFTYNLQAIYSGNGWSNAGIWCPNLQKDAGTYLPPVPGVSCFDKIGSFWDSEKQISVGNPGTSGNRIVKTLEKIYQLELQDPSQ